MRKFLFFLLFICCSISLFAADIPGPEVKITAQDGVYKVVTPYYCAVIGADGNLHSVKIKDVEFIDTTSEKLGLASFFDRAPVFLTDIKTDDNTVTASSDYYKIKYIFNEGFFNIYLRQNAADASSYTFVGSKSLQYVMNLKDESIAAVPASLNWGDIALIMPGGERLEIFGGSTIWKLDTGQQVCERSNIPQNQEVSLTIVPRVMNPLTAPLIKLTDLSVVFSGKDWIAVNDDATKVAVTIKNNSNDELKIPLSNFITNSQNKQIYKKTTTVVVPAHTTSDFDFDFDLTMPDFYTIKSSISLEKSEKSSTVVIGYKPDQIQLPATRPSDFDDYWQKIADAAKTENVSFRRIPDEKNSTTTVQVFRIVMESGEISCYGWLAVPRKKGKYPGLLMLQGEYNRASKPNTSVAACGLVTMMLEPTGQLPDNQQIPLNTRVFTSPTSPDDFGMRKVVIRYLQALDVLAKSQEVDGTRLAVTGIGTGGAISIILAALDSRVKAIAPDVMSYSVVDYGMKDDKGNLKNNWPYPEAVKYIRENPDMSAKVLNTMLYFDTCNFASVVKIPVMISAGLKDSFAPPTNIYSVFNRLNGPRVIKMYFAGHEGGAVAHWEIKVKWLLGVLGEPLPVEENN
jgi:cephalosporin-C deacetylase